jgi:hypothetical protein
MPAREIKEGDTILVLTDNGWTRAVVQVVYRDRYGPTAVMCGGKRYEVAQFKKR